MARAGECAASIRSDAHSVSCVLHESEYRSVVLIINSYTMSWISLYPRQGVVIGMNDMSSKTISHAYYGYSNAIPSLFTSACV